VLAHVICMHVDALWVCLMHGERESCHLPCVYLVTSGYLCPRGIDNLQRETAPHTNIKNGT
jgi:hypothetical protein